MPIADTLGQQGLTVDVSCSYEPTRKVVVPKSGLVLHHKAFFAGLGGTEVSANATALRLLKSKSSLVYWPCKSAPNGMCGRHLYNTLVGNITWTVSPQTTIFYQSTTRIFSTHEPSAPSPTAVSTIINSWLMGLGITADGQNFQANPVAESVITFAVEPPQQPTPPYLRLFEQMFQGIEVCPINNFHFRVIHLLIVVPQATHIQYSTANPPSSCTLRAASISPLRKLKEHIFLVLHIVIRNAEHTGIWSTINTCSFAGGKCFLARSGTGSLSYRFTQSKPSLPIWDIPRWCDFRSTRVRDKCHWQHGHSISGDDNQSSCFGYSSLVSFTLSIGEL